jgi:ABC-type phosphate/phosphonate transport system permease subunit
VRHNFQNSGFGFEDLVRAFRYPFHHKVALLCGAVMYGLLLLVGFRGHVVAFVIMFGCIAHVISQVAWGRLDRSFLPDFSAFSMWDDVAVPIGLGIGITIVVWGPVIAILLALFFGVISGPKISPLGALATPAEQRAGGLQPGDLAVLTDPNADPKKLEEANNKLNQLRPGAQISQEAEKSKKAQSDPLAELRFFIAFFQVPWVLSSLLLLSVLWGIFYGPMALAVAGYTEDFGSVVNPLVGLDTIRRMGATYFKAFGMVILIQVVGLVIAVVVAVILSPLDLPFLGNLPARFVDGSVTFYFNLVIACVLGLSLHKCADRLGIGVE